MLAEANPDTFLHVLALSLNNSAVRQGKMGLHTRALASIEEAVSTRRKLADANPDAFVPDLTTSLSVLGDCLETTEQISKARDAATESLRLLAPFHRDFAGVFDELARITVKDYVNVSRQVELEPDWDLLGQYIHLFESGELNG
ncbi:MAG TPA: hypothetical protein VH325_11300 [Bryobacteraceae bacterium]|nr:hypothetical protein [Bryobacteraceae bacterium]